MRTIYRAVLTPGFGDSDDEIWEGPHYLLPATPEAYEKQVEAMAKACFEQLYPNFEYLKAHNPYWSEFASNVLRAIGINPPRAAKKLKGRK